MSKGNQNCDDACNENGLVCTEEDQFKHNSDIDSCSDVEDLVQEITGTKSVINCILIWGTEKDVPNCYNNLQSSNIQLFRHSSVKSRDLSDFDCATVPSPRNANKQRLCYYKKE